MTQWLTPAWRALSRRQAKSGASSGASRWQWVSIQVMDAIMPHGSLLRVCKI
jgi:hypothetical protein